MELKQKFEDFKKKRRFKIGFHRRYVNKFISFVENLFPEVEIKEILGVGRYSQDVFLIERDGNQSVLKTFCNFYHTESNTFKQLNGIDNIVNFFKLKTFREFSSSMRVQVFIYTLFSMNVSIFFDLPSKINSFS